MSAYMKAAFGRDIPDDEKDFREVKHPDGLGVAYTYTNPHGQLCAIAFSGKRTPWTWRFAFRSEASRQQRIAQFFAALTDHEERKRERAGARKKPHAIEPGAVVYNSWGYEQTNIDFYVVEKVSANFVWLRKCAADLTDGPGCAPMAGYVVALPEKKAGGEATKHAVRVGPDGKAYITFKHGGGWVWDGRPKYCSWYA